MWGGEGEVEYQTFPVRRACAVVGSRRQIIIPAPVLVSNACDPSHSTTVSQPWLSMNHTWTYVLIFWISCFPLSFSLLAISMLEPTLSALTFES